VSAASNEVQLLCALVAIPREALRGLCATAGQQSSRLRGFSSCALSDTYKKQAHMQVSNMTGAVNAPTTPQHSTQSMLSTQQNARQQGFQRTPDNAASPRLPGVDAQTAAELAAAATRAPQNLSSLANAAALREAYNAGVSSRSGSPMIYDQIVPAMDNPASGAAQDGGITFRPIAVRSKTEAAHAPGGWRFGDGSSPAWGSGAGTPFQPAAFSGRHTPTHVKAEQQQEQQQGGHAVPAHSANGGENAGCSTKNRRSLSRAVSGQLAPEPSLRDALLERSGDSNALAGSAEPDLLSPLPHDNHAELPLEARHADGGGAVRGIPRVSSRSTLTRCVCP